MKHAAVYFRCSTDKQDKSIGDQRQTIEDFADRNNFEITDWFDKDDGKSGTSFEKRPDFMRMVRLVEGGRNDFTRILVYDVDRWGRPIDPEESVYWEYHLKRYGVRVIYVSDESVNDNSMAGRLTKTIKQELATEESRKQSVRVRERSKMRAAEGFRVGGFAPYGFKRQLVDAQKNPIRVLEHGERKAEKSQRVVLVPGDPEEINVVHRIYNLKIDGHGVRAIANKLNEERIKAPSATRPYSRVTPGKWGMSSVWGILRNPLYIGDWTYNRQARGNWVRHEAPGLSLREDKDVVVAVGAHKGIVSPEVFEKVNSGTRLKARLRPSGISYRSAYLLSGLIKCSNCNYNFHGHTRTVSGKKYHYYEDSGFNLHGKAVCSQTMIPRDKIEQFILAHLDAKKNMVVDEKRLRSLLTQRLKRAGKQEAKAGQNERLRVKQIDRKIENLKDSLEQGVDIKFVKDRLEKLDAEKLQIEREMQRSDCKAEPTVDVETEVEKLMELSKDAFMKLGSDHPQRMKDALRVFVDRVEVDPGKRKATFYVNKIPSGTRAWGDNLSVTSCRRSDLNRQGIATGGF